LNDYYAALAIADNALLNNSMPPESEHAAKLKMMADTMPAPLRAVLHQLAIEGSRGVNQGIGRLLSRQVQAAIGDVCRTTIEGNYPFSPDSSRDVGIDDFTRMFAHGGVIDDFFTRTLAPFVDTAAKPWRYRTLPGATEAVHGPDLAPFEHAKAIRDIFFNEVDRKRPSWKVDIRIPELDPTIMSLSLDIDGQTWPGRAFYGDLAGTARWRTRMARREPEHRAEHVDDRSGRTVGAHAFASEGARDRDGHLGPHARGVQLRRSRSGARYRERGKCRESVDERCARDVPLSGHNGDVQPAR
jgi:hypothetical protein